MSEWFVSAPKGLTKALAQELSALGVEQPRPTAAGVKFAGSLTDAYRVVIGSRLGNRVLRPIDQAQVLDSDGLYDWVRGLPWDEFMEVRASLAVDVVLARSPVTHSQFAAQRVKDAICDFFRARCGLRPDVDLESPDLRVNVLLRGKQGLLSIDVSGGSLHRRGYREHGSMAPLKENLAAGLLRLADWRVGAEEGRAFIDPLCGSGTLLIEAGLMAANIAPGCLRRRLGSPGWFGHDQALWAECLAQADAARRPLEDLSPILGFDSDAKAVDVARENVRRAGLESVVTVRRAKFSPKHLLAQIGDNDLPSGLLLTNPPYGERLGQDADLRALYEDLGRAVVQLPGAWRASVFTGASDLSAYLGIEAARRFELFNGPIASELWSFGEQVDAQQPAADLSNRLRKNRRVLKSWRAREQVSCFRLYDADLPEFAFALDLYEDAESGELSVHLQEYAPPKSVPEASARERLAQGLASVCEVLEVPRSKVHVKRRLKQRGSAQYGKLAREGCEAVVAEGAARFWVNFSDYLDTGLFLDHRPVRLQLAQEAAGRAFLNLFSYTASASVHAALGGAISTTSVDLSPTYTAWARRNFELNGLHGDEHALVQADVMTWLARAAESGQRFDLIFCDPPTFSNSKRTDTVFDVQRDHEALITAAMALLAKDGVLVFSTNQRRFQLADDLCQRYTVEDVSARTIGPDFKRNARIHRCWSLNA